MSAQTDSKKAQGLGPRLLFLGCHLSYQVSPGMLTVWMSFEAMLIMFIG